MLGHGIKGRSMSTLAINLKLCGHDTDILPNHSSDLKCKLMMRVSLSTDFGSHGQRSTLAVLNVLGKIQTTAFVQSFSNFQHSSLMMRE